MILNKVVVDEADSRTRRIRKSFSAVTKDKEIIRLLNNLERDKSALLLCISIIDM